MLVDSVVELHATDIAFSLVKPEHQNAQVSELAQKIAADLKVTSTPVEPTESDELLDSGEDLGALNDHFVELPGGKVVKRSHHFTRYEKGRSRRRLGQLIFESDQKASAEGNIRRSGGSRGRDRLSDPLRFVKAESGDLEKVSQVPLGVTLGTIAPHVWAKFPHQ